LAEDVLSFAQVEVGLFFEVVTLGSGLVVFLRREGLAFEVVGPVLEVQLEQNFGIEGGGVGVTGGAYVSQRDAGVIRALLCQQRTAGDQQQGEQSAVEGHVDSSGTYLF